jgi:hypothetical protein
MPRRQFPRRRSNTPAPFKVGDKIRPISAFGHHSYEPGRCYTVVRLDESDQTLMARDASGREGNWIKWCDCRKTNDIGWDWLKTVLPAEALDLLSAFEGLEHLDLRDDLRNRLLLQIPGLHDKILQAMTEEELVVESGGDQPKNDASLIDFADLD